MLQIVYVESVGMDRARVRKGDEDGIDWRCRKSVRRTGANRCKNRRGQNRKWSV